jgi:hypothetical protein
MDSKNSSESTFPLTFKNLYLKKQNSRLGLLILYFKNLLVGYF